MKVREYLRQPGVHWVNHSPRTLAEECLETAINKVYSGATEEWTNVIERCTTFLRVDSLPVWNDSHTLEDVLKLVDELDI